ncbi:hypothetical protein ma828 [Moumouvirus australiensis]|uniref:Uncharacterized protein n=1 Tax=Moumouvirus australiensis TaxID=2109587 RepID=A0A2P1EMT3_9VIRU|nr:hypothetical protein QKC55_gp076 [Moumouvirus australiensis]AVL95215.1 hypothetical protein ma828 [Moumouvirus australiensis]
MSITNNSNPRAIYQAQLDHLKNISDEDRDNMSNEQYKSFCQEYENLHYILWPSSTLYIPNRMSPEKRLERNKRDAELYTLRRV